MIPENPLEVGRASRKWIAGFEDKTLYFEITKIHPLQKEGTTA